LFIVAVSYIIIVYLFFDVLLTVHLSIITPIGVMIPEAV